jgi:hypothetical protein
MSTLQASDLDTASRSDLIARAEGLGIEKADVLTRAELVDEIVKRTVADPIERRLARGLLGVARDLVARVVERGLHLPDAAALIRGLQQVTLTPVTPPIATVTLAEIYAGQGHRTRALSVLDEVLANEPEHAAARVLRDRVAGLPVDTASAIAPSEPPPSELSAPEPAAAESPLSESPLSESPPPVSHRERDTLPPAADFSSNRVSTDVPHADATIPYDLVPDERPPSDREPSFGDQRADEIVLMPVDSTSAVARWELGTPTLEAARARARGGELILRIVAVTPSWDGPKVEIRDIDVALAVGDWWVCDLPPRAVLRAAIGWRSDEGFDPLAVALDIAALGPGASIASDESAAQPSDEAGDRSHGIEERARRRAEEGRPAEGRALSSWRTLALAPWEEAYEEMQPAGLATR